VLPRLAIMFFGSTAAESATEGYELVLQVAREAERLGYHALWTPERHFHPFGGLFPNPAVLGAALARTTRRVQIRAGSVVAPLNDPLRIAEDWAVVDNLSSGRVGISFGSGWNPQDFVLDPGAFERRAAATIEAVDVVRRLWRGEAVVRRSADGEEVEVTTYPRPVQPELPVWLTAAGNPETFRTAGRIEANVLTHLLGQDLEQLSEKMRAYRRAREEGGAADGGVVSVMLHTHVGETDGAARRAVRGPLIEYMRMSLGLEMRAAAVGGRVSRGAVQVAALDEAVASDLLTDRFERTFAEASLLGSLEKCEATLARLGDHGVDEVACLVDFGLDADAIVDSLERLAALV
jgi:natural product biosynthesis luciferase-like monooxygenase protein